VTTTSDVVFPPAPRTSISQRLLRRAGRIYSSVAVAVTGRRRQTLHHELAWRPVVVSLVIVLLGSSATSAWMAYQSVRDRKKLIQSFAQFARNDLETNLRQVFAEVQDIAGRWEGFLTLTDDPTAQKSLSRFLEPAILHKSAGNWYDVLLFLQTDGTIFKAVSGASGIQLEKVEGRHYSSVLGSSADVATLQDVLTQGRTVGIPVRQLPGVNALLGRTAKPRTRRELPSWYQFVVSVPVRAHPEVSMDRRVISGALVAVVAWRPFQDILDGIERKSALLDLDTGYAYLMDSDGNTVIGHKLRDPNTVNLYETRVEEDHHLPELRRLLRDSPGIVYPYWFRGVRKYAALQRIAPPIPELDEALGWRLGVGVDLPDMLWAAVPSASLVFIVGLFVTFSVYAASHVIASRASLSVNKLTELVDAASRGEFTVVKSAASHEELSDLHDAISRLIVTLRAEVGFLPLPNPYIVGTPIRTATMFYGREDDVAWIGDQLRTPGNELILLSGQRRVGKTSLLHSIRRADQSMRIVSFFFDSQMLMVDVVDDATFFRVLTAGLVEQLAQTHPEIPAPNLSRYDGEALAVRKFLKYVIARLDVTPVLLFDELENLQYKVQHQMLSQEVFNFFAALLDSEMPFSMVVTGSDHVERRKAGGLGSLLVKAMPRRLSVLAPDKARELVMNPLKGRVEYDDECVDRILRFTGSHPYYTQDFCHRMVSTLNQQHQVRVTQPLLSDVITRVLDNPPPQLEYGWEQLPELGKVLVCGMAATITNADEYVGVQDAINALPPDYQQGLPPKRHRTHNALVTLIHRDWLEQTDRGYRFKVDLYRLWLKREHPPTQLSEFSWEKISKGPYADQSIS